MSVTLTAIGAPLAGASPRPKPPTRLWYKITVGFSGTQDLSTTHLHFDANRRVRTTEVISTKGTTGWTARTEDSVLLRKQPRGAVNFISNGGGSAVINSEMTHSTVITGESNVGHAFGPLLGPCVRLQREIVAGGAVADLWIVPDAPGGRAPRTGELRISLQPIFGRLRQPAGVCRIQSANPVTGEPTVYESPWDQVDERREYLTMVHPYRAGGGYSYEHSVLVGLGRNFGKRLIRRTVVETTTLDRPPVVTPQKETYVEGVVKTKYTITLRRCRGTRFCE